MRQKSLAGLLIIAAFATGYLLGHKLSKNPTIVRYEQQAIVITHGEKACPEGHSCQWKAWDLDDNKEVE